MYTAHVVTLFDIEGKDCLFGPHMIVQNIASQCADFGVLCGNSARFILYFTCLLLRVQNTFGTLQPV
jgi:hypothetical protein